MQSGRKYNISVGRPFALFRIEDGYGVFPETSFRICVSRYTLSQPVRYTVRIRLFVQ